MLATDTLFVISVLIAPVFVISVIVVAINIPQEVVAFPGAKCSPMKQNGANRCRYDGHHIDGNNLKHVRKYNLSSK